MSFKLNGIYYEHKQPDAIVAGAVAIYENAWVNPEQTISDVEAEVRSGNICWERAQTIGAGIHQDHRTNSLIRVSYFAEQGNKVLQKVSNQYNNLLVQYASSYAKTFNTDDVHLYFETFNLLKYTQGKEYKAHYDGGSRTKRVFSVVSYLNDDYEGGELEFEHFKVKIKPEPGMLIIFPSNYAYRHVAHPILSGTKYAMATWVTDDTPIF